MNFLVNPVFWGHFLRVYVYTHVPVLMQEGQGISLQYGMLISISH